ncbi:MAG: hypothetical protein JL50_11360 [Peptococcaceae bacterium BICA1-7]|nr:MAG: hypothetical protein JL50_11360 [Peptococcaceae bacterium BICA1-7]
MKKNNHRISIIIRNINISMMFYMLFFVAYLIPPIYNYFNTEYFAFVNAWDEETYLSYQGAIGVMDKPGYYLLHVVYFLHKTGISGGIQNFLFDLIVPPLVFYMLIKSFIKIGVNKNSSYFYSIIILFGSLLLNTANPLISEVVQKKIPYLISGLESYPSILRTPNPELSYLIIAIFIWLAINRKNIFFLFLPLPFLYFAVAVPYFFVLISLYLYLRFNKKNVYAYILTNAISAIVLGIILCIMLHYIASSDQFFSSSRFAVKDRSFLISISFIVSLSLYVSTFCLAKYIKYTIRSEHHYVFITAISTLLFISNQQALTGFKLDPKNFEAYGGAVVASIVIALVCHILQDIFGDAKKGIICYYVTSMVKKAIALTVLCLLLSSQGFDFSELRYKIFLNNGIDYYYVDKIKKDSLHAIVPYNYLSSRMTLIEPKILAPPFSYQYNYPFFDKTCLLNEDIMRRAYNYIESNADSDSTLSESWRHLSTNAQMYFEIAKNNRDMRIGKDKMLCSEGNYRGDDFFIVPTNNREGWGYFPDW